MEIKHFIDRWEENEIDMARFCGRAMATCPQFVEAFLTSFAEELFNRLETPQRIEFLYDPTKHHLDAGDQHTFHKAIDFKIIEELPCIRDKEGTYGGISVMLLRNLDPPIPTYSIRIFDPHGQPAVGCNGFCSLTHPGNFAHVSGCARAVHHTSLIDWQTEMIKYEHVSESETNFWNFVLQYDKVEIHSPLADGVNCMRMTRRLANLVRWVSNLLGFEESLEGSLQTT